MTASTKQQSSASNHYFEVTGLAGHARIAPLVPKEWIDNSPNVVAKNKVATTKEQATDENKVNGSTVTTMTTPTPTTTAVAATTAATTTTPDFLWENCPRRETRNYRDNVKVYSHLPNGRDILDSKWVLGRLLSSSTTTSTIKNGSSEDTTQTEDPLLATLETHCFRGIDGYENFCNKVGLNSATTASTTSNNDNDVDETTVLPDKLPDLYPDPDEEASEPSAPASTSAVVSADSSNNKFKNLWVVKDAMTNGAGAVWVIGPENFSTLMNPAISPLYKDHMYVAQKYTYPMILFQQRKCHVRVYAIMTANGNAYVHHRAFLHVANDVFEYTTSSSSSSSSGNDDDKGETMQTKKKNDDAVFQDSVHITNCCANSHDPTKFAGEILADFYNTEYQTKTYSDGEQVVVPLAPFFPSICASIRALAKRTFPFLNGGQVNNGFEYMGMDFILSHKHLDTNGSGDGGSMNPTLPVAYLLEVNAPPSQETATQLQHAEDLHNEVIQDLINMWVVPNVANDPSLERPGGWVCVYNREQEASTAKKNTMNDVEKKEQIASTTGDGEEEETVLAPSKAVIINKIKWTLYERAAMKRDKQEEDLQRRALLEHQEDFVQACADNGATANGDVPTEARLGTTHDKAAAATTTTA